MNKFIAFVVIVLMCSKSPQSILIYVKSYWIYTSQSNIYPQIEFETVDQQGIAYVVRDNIAIRRALTA